MKFKSRNAISLIELAFIVFVLFFIYTFVVKQMIADMRFSDLRRSAAISYTILDTASRKIIQSGGFPNRFRSETDLTNGFAKELAIDKVCADAQKEDCWSSNWIWSEPVKAGIKLQGGQFVVGELSSATCISSLNIKNTCGAIYIDTNGSKAPNRIGHDMIKLYVTANGLIPAGVKEDIMNPVKGCDMVKKFNWGCSAKLLGQK